MGKDSEFFRYNQPLPLTRSSGWKDVTLRIKGSNDELVMPVMTATRVEQIIDLLKERLCLDDDTPLEFFTKQGMNWKRQRRHEEIGKTVFVKGIASFQRRVFKHLHPLAVIGSGMVGLRQGIELVMMGNEDFSLFERKGSLGGCAWRDHANPSSKLQSEGPSYQVQWHKDLPMVTDYGMWPSRAKILQHMQDMCEQYGVSPHVRFNSDVRSMIIDEPNNSLRNYTLSVHAPGGSAGDDDDDDDYHEKFICSGMFHYPGALRDIIRKDWPGEAEFGGQVAYGIGGEIDYKSVVKTNVVIVGMGAFAVENARTCFENGAAHAYVVARNQNLLLPRLLSWWMNCSPSPVPAAMVLNSMRPMYDLAGWDPWSNNAVHAGPDRKTAHIKQSARPGIGDFFFLATFYGWVEVIQSEVKRLSHRTVHLLCGRVLDDIDHFIKVVGFTADYTVDRLHQVDEYIAFWPHGDWQRHVWCEMGAVDASHFGGTSLSPGANSLCFQAAHYLLCPHDARALLGSGTLPKNKARLDARGVLLPAYVWDPRLGAMASISFALGCRAIREFDMETSPLKRGKMFELADPERFVEECAKDWNHYCKIFKDRGDCRDAPPYPYALEFTLRILRENDAYGESLFAPGEEGLAANELKPNTVISMEPAQEVMKQRSGCRSPSPSKGLQDTWLQAGREVELRLRTRSQSPTP